MITVVDMKSIVLLTKYKPQTTLSQSTTAHGDEKMRSRLAISISLLLLLQLQLQCSATVFKLTNAVCESYNKTWLEFELCRLRAVSRHKGQLMKKANGYKPWLYSVFFNGCQFIRRRNNPLIKLVWELFKEFSTLNHTCPYVGQQLIKDFYLRPEKLPTPMPTGEYLVLLTWIINKKPQAATNFYFTFVEDL